MASTGDFLIYAELLSNIRQVSVVVSLSSPADASTKAEVSQHGRQLQVAHQGQIESISLPAQVVAPEALPIPRQGVLDLSWRLPVAPSEAKPPHFSLENQTLPWTSVDIEAGSRIACRQCDGEFVSKGTIKAWKDLPSENWAEMMEFWHCHKPHDDNQHDAESLASKGYGANSAISAQAGVGFVDLTSFLFSESNCSGLAYSSSTVDAGFDLSSLALDDTAPRKFLHVFCKKCRTEVGLFNILALSVTLFKWQITCQTLAPSLSPSSSECLAATLMATISRSGSSKSIITPHMLGPSSSEPDVSRRDLYLWVLNPNVVYSSSSVSGSKTAMKILYRGIGVEEGNGLIDSLNSDVQEISLPQPAIEAATEKLLLSGLLLPTRERTFKEWQVGLLGRWEPSV
ncbi:ubiquitin-conjugating enzyme E2-binding protein [Ilyonectria robusta]|uniref:ubiquitin-conjugating enzyme E2-binding protein n=1 Tax=Ilyonectria robusta TaxID=1079257 RepID=UPI001E8DF60E|nr:ubiquitin-conjugating enzyme E2-binding protein [Ilyonectria robusta]KAH8737099.1 ubiquitin-conjugating enzyme E2-binding protein [Ilyonectria robusta]